MKLETRTYQLIGETEILGSQPCSKEVRTQYIASKTPAPQQDEDDCSPDLDEKGLSVFYADQADGACLMMDYQLRGYLKAAGKTLASQLGLSAVASKIDTLVFVQPRKIFFLDDAGQRIRDTEQLERPLRAETARGPRVALAASEMIPLPWNLTFTIALLANKPTTKSGAITFDVIEELLGYGFYQGLGQWRNGGYGRFDFKRLG